MFQHDGVTTNNHAEGYNYKLNSNSRIKKHPNPYLLVDVLKKELRDGLDDCIAVRCGNPDKKVYASRKLKSMMKRRMDLQKNLQKGYIDLLTYQQAIGGRESSEI